MSDRTQPRGVHLVGSVPLADAEQVFRTVADLLGRHVRRIPDGETGERADWIVWQMPVLQRTPQLQTVPPDPEHYRPLPRVQLQDGVTADQVSFPELGYARAATDSYRTFDRLSAAGELPPDVRFQVSLPTPLAPIGAFVMAEDQAALEPRYEAAMMRELDAILGAIPPERLALQWDTAVEFGILEGLFPAWFDDREEGVVERLVRIGSRVPADVPLGYHLCYGDSGHKHFTEPKDTALLTQVATGLLTRLPRPVNWLHLPVPRSRDDEAYFEPLTELQLPEPTELYLGLVHFTDGVAGARRRVAAASRVVPEFGVATECGLGRRPPETIPPLLQLHAEVSHPLR